MTNTSTAVNDITRALVAGMRSVTGYRSCWTTAATGTPVYHSAEVALMDDVPRSFLVIGHAGDPAAPGEAGDGPQKPATLGTLKHRQETGSIRCLAAYQIGDVDETAVQRSWDGATAITDAVDAYLRGHGSLGLAPPYRDLSVMFAGVTGVRPYIRSGAVTEIDFLIGFTARI